MQSDLKLPAVILNPREILILISEERVPRWGGDGSLVNEIDRPLTVVRHANRCPPCVDLDTAVEPTLTLGGKERVGQLHREGVLPCVLQPWVRCPDALVIRRPQV